MTGSHTYCYNFIKLGRDSRDGDMSVGKSRRGAWIYISSGTPGACPYKGCISRGAAIGSTARLLPGSLRPPAVRTETTKRNREKLHPISAFIVSSDSINIIRFEVALIGESHRVVFSFRENVFAFVRRFLDRGSLAWLGSLP